MTLCVSKALTGLRLAEQGMLLKVNNSMAENLAGFEEAAKYSRVDEVALSGAAPA